MACPIILKTKGKLSNFWSIFNIIRKKQFKTASLKLDSAFGGIIKNFTIAIIFPSF